MFLDHKATLVPRNLRVLFVQVAQRYLAEDDKETARELLNKSLEVIPESVLPMDDYVLTYYIEMLYNVGETEKAQAMLTKSVNDIKEQTQYFFTMSRDKNKRIKKIAQGKLYGGNGVEGDIGQMISLSARMQDTVSMETLQSLKKLYKKHRQNPKFSWGFAFKKDNAKNKIE